MLSKKQMLGFPRQPNLLVCQDKSVGAHSCAPLQRLLEVKDHPAFFPVAIVGVQAGGSASMAEKLDSVISQLKV